MSAPEGMTLKYVAKKRRPREDRRFVAGAGRFAADVHVPGTKHMAVTASPYPAARIISIDASAALAMPGVIGVVTGNELAEATNALASGVDIPKVKRYPLAVGQTRYAGEWVVAIVADSRAQAEDAAECVEVDYERLPYVLDTEEALTEESPPVHSDHGSNVLYRRTFTWGEVARDFAEAEHETSFRVVWGRSSTVPLETFQVTVRWDDWRDELEVWASIQMPKYPEQIAGAMRLPSSAVRVHLDVDIGGSYGVKRGLKQTVLAGFAARKFGVPVQLIEDRLENMRAGDAHGPDRIFDLSVAFESDGVIRSMKMRALDNVGAYAGRSPLQLGKPVGAIVGPYQIASVEYEAIAVSSNKAAQEAVRGFGQAPTNYAIETAVDRVARFLDIDPLDVRRANFIRTEQFPYLIPSGTTYDSGDYHAVLDKVLAEAEWPAPLAWREDLRQRGGVAGIGIAACLEPSGGNSSFEPLFNLKNKTTTWMEGCRVTIDTLGGITATI
ncbi:MAG: xanthine dehydrogenase family protein molybdopterin-binding subunit, partial [Rhodospirillaceae bacterium]|nr:xanthine dehydrogenase family protein molybdopterin-binding subunit [Rhodospirillaceae bacterium]